MATLPSLTSLNNATLPILVEDLKNDKEALRDLPNTFVHCVTTFIIYAPISDQARERTVKLINDRYAIALISSVCAAAVGDIKTAFKNPKTGSLHLPISDASWAAFEKLWDKCGVPAEDWRLFKESAQKAGMTWDMLVQVAAAQILVSSTESSKSAILNESLREQMRKMAMGANPNIRVHPSIGGSVAESVAGELIKNPGPDLLAALVVLFTVLCYGLTTGDTQELLEGMSFGYLTGAASSAASSAGALVGTVASTPPAWVWLLFIIKFIQDLNSPKDDD